MLRLESVLRLLAFCTVLLLGLATAGCALVLDGEDKAASSAVQPPPVPLEDEVAARAALEPTHLSATELETWNNPAFQQLFTKSYLSETDQEPRTTNEEKLQIQQILEPLSKDRLDEAAALLQTARANPSASAAFDFMLGNIYFRQDQFDRAVAAYELSIKKHAKFLRAWRNLALIHCRQRDYVKALPALTRVVELGGGDALIYGLLGHAYSFTENHLAAESAYRLAIMLAPTQMDWKMGLIRSLFKQERYADAVSFCSRLIADQPDRGDLWLLQANAYIGLGLPLKAAENYELVDRLGQATSEHLNTLGDIYINGGIYDLALSSYLRAMDRDSGGKPARAIAAAKVMASRGATAEAMMLVAGIEKRHGARLETAERKDLLKVRARVATAEGTTDEEVRVLEEIVALDPLDGEALILLGQHSSRAGQPDKAILYYERAENLEKHEADAKVRHAQLLVGQSKYAEALPLLRRAQQLKPRDSVQQYLEQVERISRSR